MAEAVGAFYAVETTVEGLAAGAIAVSGSTVPLHGKFKKIGSPSPNLGVHGTSALTVKNKIYLIGGEYDSGNADYGVHVLSFPPDFGSSRTDGSPLDNLDYELRKPELVDSERPLKQLSDQSEKSVSSGTQGTQRTPWSRVKHTCALIDDKIYILGGIDTAPSAQEEAEDNRIVPLDNVTVYDTLKNSYSVLSTDHQKSTEGVPEARYAASCTSSPYPQPTAVREGDGPTSYAHGTIFLHGGFDAAGLPLHDTWTLDLGTKAWHKFPSIVDDVVEDTSVPGCISYLEHRLWYVNGSTVMYLDLAEHDPNNTEITSPDPSILSTGRVGSGQWQVVYPPANDDPAATSEAKEKVQEQDKRSHNAIPDPPTAHLVTITTGAGRCYLIHVSSRNPTSLYTFQLPSTSKTGASIKDIVRDKAVSLTSLPDSWRSGKHEWSKIEIIQADMKDGVIENPDTGLNSFAACGWQEYGNIILFWGGRRGTDNAENEGWMLNLE